jgi:leucyl-tRNA synthetase
LNEITGFHPQSNADKKALCFALQKEVILLSPFAPHIAEEIWQKLGGSKSIFNEPWPQWDEALTKEDEIELVVQINGKLRNRIMIPSDMDEDAVRDKALQDKKIAQYIDDKPVKKIIVIKRKLVNIVIEK